jgi:hypothetical protein
LDTFVKSTAEKMSRILIGSSNIRRFYGNMSDQPKYKIETATIYRAFEVTMGEVVDGDKIIISVIENLIEKAISPKVEAEKMQAMINTMTTLETIVQISKRCPGMRTKSSRNVKKHTTKMICSTSQKSMPS